METTVGAKSAPSPIDFDPDALGLVKAKQSNRKLCQHIEYPSSSSRSVSQISQISQMESLKTAPTQLRESLRQANVDHLLEYLSARPELRLGKNEQRGDPDLTVEEKRDILRRKYETSPTTFLVTYGRFLLHSHLECFSSMRRESHEINYYLSELEASLSPEAKKRTSKNRRYEALQKLVDTTDYFTEEEMQRRNPILYDQLIGKYHTEEEREAFLFQSASTSSAIGSKNDSSYDSKSRPTPLSDMLIAHMSRGDGECSNRRIDQESQINEENLAEGEYDYSGDSCMGYDEIRSENAHNHQQEENVLGEEIDENEKELLKEEFFTTMYRHFLEGKDEDIDYAAIDENSEYDCGETFDQDVEERYFDSEDASLAGGAEDNFSEVDIFHYGAREPETNTVDKSITVAEGIDTINTDPDSNRLHRRCESENDNSDEDPLDVYMSTIDLELNRQSQSQ